MKIKIGMDLKKLVSFFCSKFTLHREQEAMVTGYHDFSEKTFSFLFHIIKISGGEY